MNKSILLFLLFSLSLYLSVFAQDQFKVNEVKNGDVITIVAVNKSYFPYSVSIKATMSNVRSDRKLPYQVVVPPKSAYDLLTLTVSNPNTEWSYRYNYDHTIGDPSNSTHTDTVIYYLPFPINCFHPILQGYDGNFSHKNENAIDFQMPVGDTILASRGGIVVDLVESNEQGCGKPTCRDFSNYITIMHNDGSLSEYNHLMKNGCLVEVGKKVNQGQPIALSGNTGFSTEPHLHFEVFLPTAKGKRNTLETNFTYRNDQGNQTIAGIDLDRHTKSLPSTNQMISRAVITDLVKDTSSAVKELTINYSKNSKTSGKFIVVSHDTINYAIPIDTLTVTDNKLKYVAYKVYNPEGVYQKYEEYDIKTKKLTFETTPDSICENEYFFMHRDNDTIYIFSRPCSFYNTTYRKKGDLIKYRVYLKRNTAVGFERFNRKGESKSKKEY